MYLFLTSFILLLPSASALWPIPVSYDHGDTVLFLRKDVQFHCYEPRKRNVGSIADQSSSRFTFASNSNTQVNSQDPLQLRKRFDETELETSTIKYATYENTSEGGSVTSDEIISYAIKSARKAIFSQNIYPWKFHPRNWSEPVQNSDTKYISTISIHILKPNSSNVADPLASPIDESYTLTIDTSGTTTISANTSLGIKHGLTTLTQLFYATANKENIYTPLAPLTIHDRPKFSHRGLNLDVARNWYPTSVIKRQIAAASYNKLNVLHLHITDSQSWPLEIPSLPDLSRKGAYRPDLVYTPSDFLNLQHYAALHGMQLITEIDMPGHTSSIHHAYPDLIAAFNIQPNWDTYAAEPPSGTLKLNSTPVTKFLDTLFADLLPRVKPYTAYFHTGGDEVNKNAYTLDDTVESNDSAILQPLMQKFVDRNHANVRNAGLTPIVWEEMLLDWNLTLGKDVVVQSWQSDAAVLNIVSKGYKALAGNYNFWYLDCGKGQWLNFPPSTSSTYWPYNDYCAPYHNWRLAYSYDPLVGIPSSLQHLVIGGEAHMWSEQTDPINVDRMIWPRAAAVAEVLWSGAKDGEGRNRSQVIAAPRLSEMRERLVEMGVGADSIQMAFCTMEGGCTLGG